jgi:hypothetical protein
MTGPLKKIKFQTKDSGKRVKFSSGMVRDVNDGKARFDLVEQDMLWRIAELYGRGAIKYGDNNWRKAKGRKELNRFKESAFRHFMQWVRGDLDEDHAAAVFFNVAGFEWLRKKMRSHAKKP